MKLIFSLIFLVSIGMEQQPQLQEMRGLYKQAAEKEEAAERLLKLTGDKKNKGPLTVGYHGVAQMMMAKHVGNPFKKLSYFNRGKDFFSAAIEADPKSLELRFLRFSVQAETPGFLNYKQNLEEDKEILLSGFPAIQDAELREMIRAYLVSSKELSDLEKRKL